MIELVSTALKFKMHPHSHKIHFELLDQTQLPAQEIWLQIENHDQLIECIKALRVRGAPLIGVAASLGLVQAAYQFSELNDLTVIFQKLFEARPTAVNLMNNLNQLRPLLKNPISREALVEKAVEIFKQDEKLCDQMSTLAASLIQDGDQIITHCNTGGLATAGLGTALGGIIKAHQQGKRIHVYVDETRPLLQGGRLTSWELMKHKVPMTLITDNMAAHMMRQKKITKAFVGADRIAANGDFANKIGTYSLAINCQFHKIPFYVVAPSTTVDPDCPSGEHIHIEQRPSFEVSGVRGSFGDITWAPKGVTCENPAFDVTPHGLTQAWILESGIFSSQEIEQGKFKNNFGSGV